MNKTYHVGIVDAARTPHGYPKTPGLLVVHACRNKDSLPPYILEYHGERATTKKEMRDKLQDGATAFLASINAKYPTRNFTKVVVV